MSSKTNGTMNDFRRRRVFLGSLMDWLDPQVPIEWLGAGRKGKCPPWHELAHEQRNACREVARWHVRKLREAKRR